MRSFAASAIVLLGLSWVAVLIWGAYTDLGFVGLVSAHGEILVAVLFVLGLLLALARMIDRQGFEDLWLVRLTLWLFPFLADVVLPKPGDEVSLTKRERLKRARQAKMLIWFCGSIALVGLLTILYFGVVWAMGWKFHFIHRSVEACETAYASNDPTANNLCQKALTESDSLVPLAHAGKVMHEDAFWIGRAELALHVMPEDCDVGRQVKENLANVRRPDQFDRFAELQSTMESQLTDIELSCRLQQTNEALKQLEHLFEGQK